MGKKVGDEQALKGREMSSQAHLEAQCQQGLTPFAAAACREKAPMGNYPLTVGIGFAHTFGCIDQRFGSGDRYHLTAPKDIAMRVPDEIRKSVLFIGVKEDLPEWEWKGTAYLIAVPDAHHVFTDPVEFKGKPYHATISYPFMFLATARHVAEKLEGKDFALRTNKLDGSIAILEGHADQKWWYHPTEKQYVDAAVAVFFPPNLRDLDINWIGIDSFVDKQIIQEVDLGVGDEVFLTGLFTEVLETTSNIPIVRMGNLAMVPGERIPFKDGRLIDAYLVESRSVGGLSGSPVFVRETIRVDAGIKFRPDFKLNTVNSPTPEIDGMEHLYLHGVGRIYFLGSMIGHWDAPTGFRLPEKEAVNMGISPVVPAHKIKEIITQPGLRDMIRNMNEELAAKKHSNAKEDFAIGNKDKPVFTQDDFETALKKASRKIIPDNKST